jgi:hypothetical protein
MSDVKRRLDRLEGQAQAGMQVFGIEHVGGDRGVGIEPSLVKLSRCDVWVSVEEFRRWYPGGVLIRVIHTDERNL